MALNAYLTLKAKRSGEIRGSVTQKGKEGRILVIAASHQLSVPSNPAAGMSSGRKVYSPFIITKELDRSSPLLYTALATNDSITEWRLDFYGPQDRFAPNSGAEIVKYTVKLTNARVTNIQFVMPNVKNPELVKLAEYEEVSFTYETIEWIWTDGPVTGKDSV